jgi:hypothetical protein
VAEKELKCFACGATDKDRVFLVCYHEGKEKVVCTRCLPMLIHGVH